MEKIINILKGVVAFIKGHGFPAFAGFGFSVLYIGVVAFLFFDKHYLFAVIATITLVLGIIPFAYDCIKAMAGSSTNKDQE